MSKARSLGQIVLRNILVVGIGVLSADLVSITFLLKETSEETGVHVLTRVLSMTGHAPLNIGRARNSHREPKEPRA